MNMIMLIEDIRYKSGEYLSTQRSSLKSSRNFKEDPTTFIKELDENEFMEFLSGLLDSDGTVTDRIVFYSASKLLLEKISERLETFSVRSHIYRFGNIFGLQIHDKRSLTTLSNKLSSGKLRAPTRLRNIGSRKTERF